MAAEEDHSLTKENGLPELTKRVMLTGDELGTSSKEYLVQKWKEQENYISWLEAAVERQKDESNEKVDITKLKESEEKLKTQLSESARRENILVMRLTTKEQELQEVMQQLSELKKAQSAGSQPLRSMMLDPAVNVMFQRLRKEMSDYKEKLEQTQNDLSAWKFTPDSQTGKRLMARIRHLLKENEELGKNLASGRTAKLESEIALEKTLVLEMKKTQADTDEFLAEMDEETESLQSTVYILQEQLQQQTLRAEELQEQLALLKQSQPAAVDSELTSAPPLPPEQPMDTSECEPPPPPPPPPVVNGEDCPVTVPATRSTRKTRAAAAAAVAALGSDQQQRFDVRTDS